MRRYLDVFSVEAAQDLAQLRAEMVALGHPSCTREFMGAALGVVEKQVFQYEDGSKRWPGAILRAARIAPAFRERLAEMQLAAARDVTKDTYSLVALGTVVERVKRYAEHAHLSDDQRRALAATIWTWIDALTDIASELSEEPAK